MRDPADVGGSASPLAAAKVSTGVVDDLHVALQATQTVRQLNQAASSHIERAERTLRLIHSGDDEPSEVTPNARAPLQSAPVERPSVVRRTSRWLMPLSALSALMAVAGVAAALQVPDRLAARPGADITEARPLPVTATVAKTEVTIALPSLVAGQAAGDDVGANLYGAHFKSATGIEQQCLARAIFYEARGEPYEGQVAVAQVIVNRVRAQRWPDSICGVVHQGEARGEKCQFSFVCQRSLADAVGPQWDEAEALATEVLAGRAWLREAVEATHYHTTAVAPVWRQDLVAVATLGNHVFYREPNGLRAGVKPYAPEAAPAALAAAARQAEAEKAAARAKAVSSKPKVADSSKTGSPSGRSDGDWKLTVFGN